MAPQKVCIIGGGVAGVGLWWTLAQPNQPGAEWDVTIIHDGAEFGGHALTVPVQHNGGTTLVDTGVQFFIPLFYPNIDALIARPEISPQVPVVPYDSLKVACGFPRLLGSAQNWGNFADYQTGENFAMFTPTMMSDAKRFQMFIDDALLEGWGSKTLADYFATLTIPYENQADFLNYFLFPYLSIINGYGAALDDQVTFDDLVPLFANLPGVFPGLGSFTQPGSGYSRFANGASSLVGTLAARAQQMKPGSAWMNSTVISVAASPTLPGPVTVTWTSGKGPVMSGQFDKVVITTDMLTAAGLLNNSANSTLWSSLYSKYLSLKEWPLLPGKCYIHTDVDMLSPDLRQQEESLQFTAYYAPQTQSPFYTMFKTYTTYLQANIHNTPESQGLYLTMYGYIPDPTKGDKVPAPDKVVFEEVWQHGMWLPTFMLQAKQNLHMAQGKGAQLSYPGQLDTGIYFAGNNTTADSLEHAFISGEVIANYAFDASYPLAGLHLRDVAAFAMYDLFYNEFMFPKSGISARLSHLRQAIPKPSL
ncbi:MAG: NAD(P)-binding protein [Gemmatimonadaceae bacterium]